MSDLELVIIALGIAGALVTSAFTIAAAMLSSQISRSEEKGVADDKTIPTGQFGPEGY